MKLNKAIFLFVVVISSLTISTFKQGNIQLGLTATKASTIQKNVTCDLTKNIANSCGLEIDEEQEEQDEHSGNSLVFSRGFTAYHTLAKALVKFNFPLPSHLSPQRNLLFIIFLKILI